MMSGHVEYQILVVTRLPAFKSAKHRPEDVVQFLVSQGLWQGASRVQRPKETHTPPTRAQVAAECEQCSSQPSIGGCQSALALKTPVNQMLTVCGETDL